ncbi:MAG: hypothetical protein KDE19_13205 [Caldilineaceae bacterium]|nr:hypothetical protein [Caldilineaceae bacterium]
MIREHDQLTMATLTSELAEVQAQLDLALHDHLYSPFRELAQSQLGRIQPLRRAAVVLATAADGTDSALLRQQRIDLATALEMLNIALVIHQLLLANSANQTDNPNQRSITGSVILTGDYCFTRSALFAAKTDNVQVVEIFSQTLKTISEGILRGLFAERGDVTVAPAEVFHTELALCEAGVVGAATLVRTTSSLSDAAVAELLAILRRWVPGWQMQEVTPAFEHLPPPQEAGWQVLQQWIQLR